MPGLKSDSGARLAKQWNVQAVHNLYDKNGEFYMPLEKFPGALFDRNGYVLFNTEVEYTSCPDIRIGNAPNIRVHIRGGISSLPGYKRMK